MIRNQVAPTYHGALFVVEDVWVRCDLCRAAVDPVVRIPVGKQWFHPQCLRCAVCSRPSKTDAFRSVRGQPVCSDCFNRGFDKALGGNGARAGGSLLPPASRGSSRASSRALTTASGASLTPRQILSLINTGSSPATPLRLLSGASTALASGGGVAGPSPTIRFPSTPFLDSRAVTKRQSELLERQRILSDGDSNILLMDTPSSSTTTGQHGSRMQTPAAVLPPPPSRSPISAIAYKHKS
ncbi:Hypothetical protein, putative [Bodo saltans]|uniref:LIM zinc-binding domain-containing protein n=1 Tax=Bodo saltans TaxID=75058 RepID=A0A0S4IZ50_BODSA|nr:Hypothetical protein, putative [Bodo saltans]|eukprot:CUG22206.1 Hypothetical protein, putative [Bodo saltans]